MNTSLEQLFCLASRQKSNPAESLVRSIIHYTEQFFHFDEQKQPNHSNGAVF